MQLKSKLTKAKMAEGPSGAAMPKAPAPPQVPKPPVAPGNSPAAQQAKQGQTAAVKMASAPPKAPQAPKPPQMGKSETYFSHKRKELTISESQLFTECEHCGVPQFTKTEQGPSYKPCACFMVTKNEQFVTLKKNETGYALDFNPKADADSVKAFLLALKARLLVTKKFGDD